MAFTEHTVMGMMSGSSLDGLDLAVCRFRVEREPEWKILEWEILAANTDPYPPQWQARLRMAPVLPGRELWRLHTDLGAWFGRRAAAFLGEYPQYSPEIAGSHGHTVFHDPDQRFTTQIGDGAALAKALSLPVVTELRGADVAYGGQGAPLAPLADKHLFPEYGALLNLGGIANLSIRREDGRYLAGDISACCQIMDRLAAQLGRPYDAGGRLAAGGSMAPAIAQALSDLKFHHAPYPKSLGNAWVREVVWPIFERAKHVSPQEGLHTFVQWLARKIHDDLAGLINPSCEREEEAARRRAPTQPATRSGGGAGSGPEAATTPVLCTGGGAHNEFLLECLRTAAAEARTGLEFVVPERQEIEFKEAALIALAALLRREGKPNALASATGAPFDTVNGALFLPTPN